MDYYQESLKLHKKHKGKLGIVSKVPVKNKKDLALAYTPGVAQPCIEIANDKSKVYDYTIKGHTVAIVSNGTAVLGLGNIGPLGAIPVMEGKAILFKELGGIDAFPICIDAPTVDEAVAVIRAVAPVFGGINLEDIKAPECFEIEARLQDLGIPVMHDDQHATAVVVLAGLTNALKVVKKDIRKIKIVINGAGASGSGTARLLLDAGADPNLLIMCDRYGIVNEKDATLDAPKRALAAITNRKLLKGTLTDAIRGADVFIGLSVKGAVTVDMVRSMAKDAIVFAMANPEPEIMPPDAKKGGAVVIATGRSDFPNQVNNVLAFPGFFKGALEAKAPRITNEMKLAAAFALASMVKKPTKEMILPYAWDKKVVPVVSKAVRDAWKPGAILNKKKKQ